MNEFKPAVIITGANGNIGSALAASLAEEGYRLILLYHLSTQRLDALQKQFNTSIIARKADITDLAGLEDIVDKIKTETDFNPKALVHTAALRSIDSASLVDSTPELWEKIITTNLIGTYNILKTMVPLMISKQMDTDPDSFSRIVLLGSDVSRIGLPYGSAYGASKAAISNLTRSLAVELAKDDVLINAISPGPVQIDDSHFPEEYRRFRAQYYEEVLKRTPLQRLAQPADIVSLSRFLISPDNNFITGEEFFITGGKL